VHGNNARNLSAYYLYLKLANMLCLSYCLLCFLFNKIGEEGSAWKRGLRGGGMGEGDGGEMAQTMYTHMNK
jgi:hypothetical protein